MRFAVAHSYCPTTASRGYTLVELLVALAMMGVLGAIAGLHYRSTEASFDRMNARSLLIQDLKRAQAETITWGCRGVFMLDPGNGRYSFGCDFLEYDAQVPPAADRVFFSRSLPTGMSLVPSEPIIFNSRGQTVDTAGTIINITVDLRETKAGAVQSFAQGVLLGTGVFTFEG